MSGKFKPGVSVVRAGVLDVLLVLVFVVIGRSSHAEGLTVAGIAETWWPFLAGLAVGWLVTAAWRNPLRILWPGVGIWIVTVGVGMLFRVVGAQGVQLSFVIVATVVLGVFLLGWRAVAALVRRIRSRRSPAV